MAEESSSIDSSGTSRLPHGGLNRDRGRVLPGMLRQIKEQIRFVIGFCALQHTKWPEHGSSTICRRRGGWFVWKFQPPLGL